MSVAVSLQAPLPRSALTLFTQTAHREMYDFCFQNIILPSANKHDFYPLHLSAFRRMPFVYMYINEKGWALVLQGLDPEKGPFVEIKYIFVFPQHRRGGFLRAVHNECARTGKRIIAKTEKTCMVRALHALGYKCYGKTSDHKELQFKNTQHVHAHG